MKRAGLRTMGGEVFHSYKDAENYVINSPARYVSKLNGSNFPHISLCSVRDGKAPVFRKGALVEEDMPVSTGDYLCVCHQTGKTVSEAKEAAYKVVKSLEIPNSVIYRTDIGDRLEEQLPSLQTLGFAEGLSF